MARVDENTAVEGTTIEREVRDALSAAGWSVEEEPVLGTVRPDLIAQNPHGETFVLEVKASRLPVHFATIAQVAGFGRLAEETRGLDRVKSILIATSPVSASAREAADALGVAVVEAPSADEDRSLWAESLQSQFAA